MKFNSFRQVEWFTYFGGDYDDQPWAIANYGNTTLYIAGNTTSVQGEATELDNFPVRYNAPAFNQSFLGDDNMNQNFNSDAFIARFSLLENMPTAMGDIRANENGLYIYPNPSNSMLYIQTAKPTMNIKVFDVLGRSVINLPSGKCFTDLNISGLPKGYYIIKANLSDSNTVTSKFVKD